MGSLFDELEEDNKKAGLFSSNDNDVLYPMGFPILDQMLGYSQDINMPDGSVYTQYKMGLRYGSLNLFVGPSSSGKTAASIQAAQNIVEPFGEDSGVLLLDAEGSSNAQRVLDVTGIDAETFGKTWRIISRKGMTFDMALEQIKLIANKKASDPKRYTYNSKVKDVFGQDIICYKPSVVIVDSLMKLVSNAGDEEEIQGLTSAGRDTVQRNKWYRNIMSFCIEYNIIVIIINHLGNDIQLQPGKGGAKQLTFIPTGKNIPGGEKTIYYPSSIIVWQPINSKDQIKTEEENGYNGVLVKAAVCKSRTGPGGITATLEFVQESGFDIDLTLVHFAKERGLIMGRNPSCYFASNPDIKFDTRIFLKELDERPELVQELYMACKPSLMGMVRKSASINSEKMENKRRGRQFLRDMCSM